jgi:hypothetical protein
MYYKNIFPLQSNSIQGSSVGLTDCIQGMDGPWPMTGSKAFLLIFWTAYWVFNGTFVAIVAKMLFGGREARLPFF